MTADLTFLTAVRARLAPEGAWTQGTGARDRKGWEVPPRNPDATCWCIDGAYWAEQSIETSTGNRHRQFAQALGFGNPGEVIGWNDAPTTTHEMVLARIDLAIARARVEV